MFRFHIILSRHQFPVLSLFVRLSGLPSSSASFNCGWHPLHPYLSGLHPRAVGPAPVGKAGELSQPIPPTPTPPHCTWLLGLSQSRSCSRHIFKSHANVRADFCDPAAVPVVYSVRLTQVPECGQVSYQCYGDPPHRWMPYILFVYTVKPHFPCHERMMYFFSVLTRAKRYSFFMPILPCLVGFCQAFPPLYDDVAALLVQVGQVCASDVATKARDIDPFITRKYCSFSGKRNLTFHPPIFAILDEIDTFEFIADRIYATISNYDAFPVSRSAVSEGEASGGHIHNTRIVQVDLASEDSRRTGWSRPWCPALLLCRSYLHGYHQLHPSWTIEQTDTLWKKRGTGPNSRYWLRKDTHTPKRTSIHTHTHIHSFSFKNRKSIMISPSFSRTSRQFAIMSFSFGALKSDSYSIRQI